MSRPAAIVRLLRPQFAALLALSALACTAASARAVDLTTYGYDNSRTSATDGHVGISPTSAPNLHTAWITTIHGAIDGEPLIVSGVRIARRKVRTLVLVGTGSGRVAAILASSGRVLWERHVGVAYYNPSCQASPDGEFGVTGTMVADPAAGRVYAVDALGRAWAFNLANGRTVRGWPVHAFPSGADFDWGALALSRGWLYVPVASLCDRGYYYGGIRAVDLAHPHRVIHWLTTAGTGSYAGGVWGWGGESIDAATGNVFTATGNAIGPGPENAGNAERVVKLSSTLRLLASNYPLAPPFPISDRDFGTSPTLIDARGCQQKAFAMNKDGVAYLYDSHHIGRGPVQAFQVSTSGHGLIPLYGMAAYDPASRKLVFTTPTAGGGYRPGLQGLYLDHRCSLVSSWQSSFDAPDAGSSPLIAEGVVYIGSGRNGVVRAYRLSDGAQLWSHGGLATVFATPAAADGLLVVGDWNGSVWAFRP